MLFGNNNKNTQVQLQIDGVDVERVYEIKGFFSGENKLCVMCRPRVLSLPLFCFTFKSPV